MIPSLPPPHGGIHKITSSIMTNPYLWKRKQNTEKLVLHGDKSSIKIMKSYDIHVIWSMWNLWCRNTHMTGYFCKNSRSSLSISFHRYSIFRFGTLPLTLHNVAQWFPVFFPPPMESPIKLLLLSWRTPTSENENKTQRSWYCMEINPVSKLWSHMI